MVLFIKEYLWVLATLFGFSLVGGFILVPFRETLKYPLLTAPLAGMLITALGVSFCYSFLSISFSSAVIVTLLGGAIATIVTLSQAYRTPPCKEIILTILSVLLSAAFLTYFCVHSSIHLGQRSLLFMDGTDQFGYIQVAEWAKTHFVLTWPITDPHFPEQSWPSLMYMTDPRFGCYYLLGILSFLQHQNAMFVFDNANAIILTAGCLGVAALFSRSPRTFILLLLSLLISSWLFYSRSGYFGKICGYPAIFFVIGLWLTTRRPVSLLTATSIAVLACAVSTIYMGTAFALQFSVIAAPSLVFIYIFEKLDKTATFDHLKNEIPFFILIVGIAFAATGYLSHPPPGMVGGYTTVNTFALWPTVLDIRAVPSSEVFPWFTPKIIFICVGTLIALLSMVAIFIIAVKKRNIIGCSMLGGALLLLIALSIKQTAGIRWILYQTTSFYFIATQCGTAWLIDSLALENRQIPAKTLLISSLIALMVLSIGLRIPRFIGYLHHYVGSGVKLQLPKSEMDQVTQAVQGKLVTVDIASKQYAIPILAEVSGHPNVSLQWSPTSWHAILSYRDWPTPPPLKPTRFYLQSVKDPIKKDCAVKLTTLNYRLSECDR